MNKTLWPILLALTLSACGTTAQKPAAVEDRSANTSTAPSANAGKGAETTGIDGSAVAGRNDTTKDGAKDPRKDPASPLSKRSIYFAYDSVEVKDEYRAVLEAHAAYLMSKREAKVIIQGNTDERGSREYNLALGQKRAEAVRKALSVMGVSDGQLEAVSFGEEKPRKEGETEAAYAENRRADVVYTDE
jgi:peptidoglycan-associated lipoprotein